MYIPLKKISTCGSYVGHIRIVLWVVSGSNGSTGVTHFQPCTKLYKPVDNKTSLGLYIDLDLITGSYVLV